MQHLKLYLKIIISLAAFVFLAGVATGYANAILFEMFSEPNQEEVSNYLKDDWISCDAIFHPRKYECPKNHTL